jgi:hypothetical protein
MNLDNDEWRLTYQEPLGSESQWAFRGASGAQSVALSTKGRIWTLDSLIVILNGRRPRGSPTTTLYHHATLFVTYHNIYTNL